MPMGMDPATQAIIGMALQAGGTLMRRREEEDMRDRQVQRQNQEADAQAEYSRRGVERVQQAAQEVAAQPRAQEANTEQLAREFTPGKSGMDVASYATANPGAPKEISDTMAAAVGRALQKGKDYARSSAALSALNRGQLDQGIAIGRSASDIGLNNNAASGSWRVAQQDINAIRPNMNNMGLSDAASGIGGLFATSGLMKGAMKKPAGWVSGYDLGG